MLALVMQKHFLAQGHRVRAVKFSHKETFVLWRSFFAFSSEKSFCYGT
eukprot:UN16243